MITYSESFIDFLKRSKCKVAKTLYKAYKQPLPAHRLMLTTEEVNYITFRDDGTISYLPGDKEPKFTPDGRWWLRDGRQNGRPAKIIRKLFTEKALKRFKDSDFECFSNSFKSKFCKGLIFQLLPNEKIPDVYDMALAKLKGTLFTSCMNGRGKFMDIYKYCESLRILILKNKDGLLCGRALIWKIGDITLMDRIYVTDNFMYDCFITYAIQHRWWYKKHFSTWENKQTFINSEGQEVQKQFMVYTKTKFESYPYIDTFTYGDYGSLNNYGDGCYQYLDTSGSRCI